VGAFGDDFKEQVRAATNLVELVSETVALKALRGGSDFVGLCPFHDDRNPSFHVYPDRQTYRCWVCDQGGDCFRWVMEIERLTFPEALESLARRARLEPPKRSHEDHRVSAAGRKADHLEVLEWAASAMHQALLTSRSAELARKYVQERKLTAETVRNFRLGYHPDDWNWFVDQARGRFTAAQMVAAGLLQSQENGSGGYSGLRGRLVFPILDERGRPVAFGGRLIPGSNIQSDAKYWNSPASSTFQKSRTLYALDRARLGFRTTHTAVVVEGYMDCIACHQAGISHVVAPLGTALTEDHVRVLRRFVERVVLVFDSDEAGQRAAEKSIARFLDQDVDLRILNVPSGKDPADFLNEHPAADLVALIETASEAWEYKLRAVVERNGTTSLAGRQQVVTEMLEFLAASRGLSGTVREDLVLKAVCGRLQVDERTARQRLAQLRNGPGRAGTASRDNPRSASTAAARRGPVPEPHRGPGGLDSAERELLEIIITCPDRVEFIQRQIGSEDLENPRHRRLLSLCLDLWKEDGELPELKRLCIAAESDSDLLSLINAVADSAAARGIKRLMNPPADEQDEDDDSGVPRHLQRVLQPLLRRREDRRQIVSRQRLVESGSSGKNFDEASREALQRIQAYRQSRVDPRQGFK
jgi:DNA primase